MAVFRRYQSRTGPVWPIVATAVQLAIRWAPRLLHADGLHDLTIYQYAPGAPFAYQYARGSLLRLTQGQQNRQSPCPQTIKNP